MAGDVHEQGLDLCTTCNRPFVVPVALLDMVDEGLYLLALHCKNCDALTVGTVEDEVLEAMEHVNDAAIAEMESALEIVSVARFIDDLGTFTEALETNSVLPEDF
jgi:hypothetical protein